MPPASNDKDGIIDRFARRLFASPDSPLTAFADRQRVERLEGCRHFERVLKSCRSAHADDARIVDANGERAGTTDPSDRPSRGGARISRFFRWNSDESDGRDGADRTAEGGGGGVFDEAVSSFRGDGGGGGGGGEANRPVRDRETETTSSRYSRDCAIETHELWACRALALGCGNYVGDLRRCWSDARESKARRALAADGMTFENGDEISCQHIQTDMANCVNKNAAELAARVQAAKNQ